MEKIVTSCGVRTQGILGNQEVKHDVLSSWRKAHIPIERVRRIQRQSKIEYTHL